MLNGARKNLSNLVLNFVTYLWDTTLEVVSKTLLIESGKYNTPILHKFDFLLFIEMSSKNTPVLELI